MYEMKTQDTNVMKNTMVSFIFNCNSEIIFTICFMSCYFCTSSLLLFVKRNYSLLLGGIVSVFCQFIILSVCVCVYFVKRPFELRTLIVVVVVVVVVIIIIIIIIWKDSCIKKVSASGCPMSRHLQPNLTKHNLSCVLCLKERCCAGRRKR